MAAGLSALGYFVYPSEGNFLLVDVHEDTSRLTTALLRRGVIVRSVASYGLRAISA